MQILRTLVSNRRGQAMAEFGLLLALIAVVTIGAFTLLGRGVGTDLPTIADEIRF